jgi:hypothetical protein
MEKAPIVILEDSMNFKRGQVIEEYKVDDDGVLVEDKFIAEGTYVMLTEKLDLADEQKVKELIRQQFKLFFWNLYTKSSINLGSL